MKRKISCAVAVLMSLSIVLSGCSGSGSNATSTDSATSATDTTAASDTAAATDTAATTDTAASASTDTAADSGTNTAPMEGNMYTTGLPIVKDKESFTIFVDDGGIAEDKYFYPILEQQTNVHVNLMLNPYDVAKQKLNVLLNSGDYPDVIGGWLLQDKDIMAQGMGEGLYVPIDDYITKYSPKMQEVLNLPGVRNTMTLPNGKIYSVPYAIGTPLVPFLPFINSDWLKKLNLQMPTTTEELRTVLQAFKDKDPNGNGKKDEIPFSGDPNNLYISTMAGWFGVSGGDNGAGKYIAMENGKLAFTATEPGYKDEIKYFASLYKDGLIDQELFTQDLATWKAKGKQGLYGVSYAYGSGDFIDVDPVTKRTQYDPLPLLKSSDSVKPIYTSGFPVTTFRTQVAITDKAKNPATIIRWFDNVFQIDNSMQIQSGPLGIKLEKLGEGQYRYLDDTKLSEADKKKYDWANLFTQSLPKFIPSDLKIAPVAGKDPDYDEKGTVDKLYGPNLDTPIASAWVSEADAKQLGIYQTDIEAFVKKKQAEWVSGQKDIDSEWAAYVAQLDKLGVQQYVQIKQKALDTMPK